MKKRWWLASSCILVLIVVAVSVQGFAAIRGAGVKAADMAMDVQRDTSLLVASFGEQKGTAGGIPIEGSPIDDPYQEGVPYDDGQLPDMQTDDLQDNIPSQDEMNQEEPYQVVPPEGDFQEEPPQQEDQPSE